MPALSCLPRARVPGIRVPPPSVARLRAAVTALFVLDGAVFGSWAARVPDVAAAVGAGHSTLGIALLCLSLGALVCMRFTGGWCARFGAGPVSAAGAVAVSAAALLPGLVGSVPALCVALFVFGAATGLVNVAANAVGVQVEASVGRPILSGLHAGFSIGGLAGALVGGALSPVLGVAGHLALVAAAGLFVSAWALPSLLGAGREACSDTSRAAGEPVRRPTAVLVVLGAIAGCTAFGEGALTDWGALLLREQLAAPATVAAAGYAGFSLAMAAGGSPAGGCCRRRGSGGCWSGARCWPRSARPLPSRRRPSRWRWPGSCSSASGWPTSSRWRSAAPACSAARGASRSRRPSATPGCSAARRRSACSPSPPACRSRSARWRCSRWWRPCSC
ncbi:MFS transporter [Blastococcus sp. PRF04-17]|uniref:MFS transporter n=1 Tax=Blastococcus sp. PRF04-17 TaxID=2933797 RepID=UPI001FF36C33|nr:MFS transporter [Blastococcus sp. PRF04-17]UOY01964.1 MFS transporter [Blastococcus sp. PRF04-17]